MFDNAMNSFGRDLEIFLKNRLSILDSRKEELETDIDMYGEVLGGPFSGTFRKLLGKSNRKDARTGEYFPGVFYRAD